MTTTFGINNRANESFATTAELKIKSETADFIKQTSVLHIQWTVRCQAAISARVASIICFLMTRKGIALSVSIVNLTEATVMVCA
jgi:hypothetical protein